MPGMKKTTDTHKILFSMYNWDLVLVRHRISGHQYSIFIFPPTGKSIQVPNKLFKRLTKLRLIKYSSLTGGEQYDHYDITNKGLRLIGHTRRRREELEPTPVRAEPRRLRANWSIEYNGDIYDIPNNQYTITAQQEIEADGSVYMPRETMEGIVRQARERYEERRVAAISETLNWQDQQEEEYNTYDTYLRPASRRRYYYNDYERRAERI